MAKRVTERRVLPPIRRKAQKNEEILLKRVDKVIYDRTKDYYDSIDIYFTKESEKECVKETIWIIKTLLKEARSSHKKTSFIFRSLAFMAEHLDSNINEENLGGDWLPLLKDFFDDIQEEERMEETYLVENISENPKYIYHRSFMPNGK